MINSIILGDCLEVMKDIPDQSVDMVLADLPYGLKGFKDKKWNSPIDLDLFWCESNRICKSKSPVVLTATQPFVTDLINSNRKAFKYEWIWEKSIASNFLQAKIRPLKVHENILVFCENTPNFYPIKEPRTSKSSIGRYKYELKASPTEEMQHYDIKHIHDRSYDSLWVNPKSVQKIKSIPNYKSSNRLHPTQKPVDLFEYLIKTYTNEGDLVLDPTIGSGTTAIAALNCNRNFIGIEKDAEYHQKSCARINEYYKHNTTQLAL